MPFPFYKKLTPVFRLLLTWFLMSGLTLVSMINGDVFGTDGITVSIGFVSVVTLMLTTLFKCRLLLLDFLELRQVSPKWPRGFSFAVFIITAMVTVTYALAFGF